MLKLLQQGRWKPLIGARFSLEHAAEADGLVALDLGDFGRCFFAGRYSVLDGEQVLRAAGISLVWVDTLPAATRPAGQRPPRPAGS